MNVYKVGDKVEMLPTSPWYDSSLHIGEVIEVDHEDEEEHLPYFVRFARKDYFVNYWLNAEQIQPVAIPFDGSIPLASERDTDDAPFEEQPR